MPRLLPLLLLCLLASACPAHPAAAQQASGGFPIDPANPWYPNQNFPRLPTPEWVGESGVEAVIVLAIDDMRDPAKYELALRPILNRLKQIDGRAPLSIMTNDVRPDDPQLQSWLGEGVSIECHTADHPCPLLQGGDFAKARSTYERCIDRMAAIPGNSPVAFRTPCCDSLNTVSPAFFDGIFNQTTPEGRFLQIDSSVFLFYTARDPELPRDRLLDASGNERFLKYLPKGNRFGGNVHDNFVNYIENYPYPWVINGVCWQIPCLAPSDWSAQHLQGVNNPVTVDDWKAAIDLTVAKRGCFSLVFHPHGWIKPEQVVELIDHAVNTHGTKVKFLNFKETADRLNRTYCGGRTLREQRPAFLDAVAQARQQDPGPFAGLPPADVALLQQAAADPEALGYPPSRRPDGTSNGFFIHNQHFCWQNEHTAGRPDLLLRESFTNVLTKVRREQARRALPLVPVGAAVVDITPDYPVRLTGYGNRQQEAAAAAVRIHARALAIGPKDDIQALLITVDNCGIPAEVTEAVFMKLQERTGVRLPRERFAISATHSHSAPWIRGFAPNIFATVPEDHAAHLARYETELIEKLVLAAEQSLQQQRPAALSLGFGEAGFAMNRRLLKEGKWAGFGEVPDGPVDKRVPILAAHDSDGKLIAVLANYACHCTTETGDFNEISGDWAGFAADYLEAEHSGAVALIAIGCGADANPSPRGTHEMAKTHGRTLADEVNRLLAEPQKLQRINPQLDCRMTRIDLPLAGVPDEAQLQEQAEQPGVAGSRARWFLERLQQGEPVPQTVPAYPVQTWCFGEDLAMVFLGGEVVVDYALRLNDMFDGKRLWINAYSNDVPCYIASARLLREGGYEVDSSMLYYRRPSRLAPETEDLICDAVQKLLPHEFYSAELRQDFPAPLNPSEALASLKTRPGMRPILAAAEPLIRDPVAFDWDERGRLWVVEMGDYPLDRHRGRIRVLTDRDGDWVYDQAETFLDELDFPSGIQCWRDGVLISMAPQVFYAADTDGDGVCDLRQPLYAGFVEGNQQHRVNGLRWGLDGWLYLANGDSGGLAAGTGEIPGLSERLPQPGQPVLLRGRDLRIHPDTNQADGVSGTTQFARERDDFGRWFGNNNSNPIWQFVLEDRYLRRNPHSGITSGTAQIAETPGAAPVFPASRTLARFNDFAYANRFTSACGTMIYRDVLLGADFTGNAFISEPVHNLVSRLVLAPDPHGDGNLLSGRRAADEQDSEFLASSDNWFRPTMLRTGPDGALWVADMYRAVIEHPEWIPAEYQRKMNLTAGNDRGRIYRILPAADCCGTPDQGGTRPHTEGSATQAESDLRTPFIENWKEIPLPDLAARMASPNGWWRDLAHRLLLHRRNESQQLPETLHRLRRIATAGGASGVQALAALLQLQADAPAAQQLEELQTALAGADANQRRMAVELLEPLLAEGHTTATRLLEQAAEDPELLVRRQVLLSSGEVRDGSAAKLLGRLLLEHAEQDSLRTAGLTSLHERNIGGVLQTVLQSDERPGRAALLSQLMAQAAAMGAHSELIAPLTSLLNALQPDAPAESWARAAEVLSQVLANTTAKQPDTTAIPAAARDKSLQAAWTAAANAELSEAQRAAALNFAAAAGSKFPESSPVQNFLRPDVPPVVQQAAIRMLLQAQQDTAVTAVLEQLRMLSPAAQSELLDGLLQRDDGVQRILDAIAAGTLAATDLDAVRRDRLTHHRNQQLAARAADLLRVSASSSRDAVLTEWRGQVAELTGHSDTGRLVFEKRCSTCHRLQDIGRDVGADLAALRDRSTESLLTAILDPNRAVEAKFMSYTVVTKDGLQFTGMLKSETGASLTLTGPDGKEQTVPRTDVEELLSSTRSLMPEGLEKDLTPQDLVDVIAFVQSTGTAWKQFPGNRPQLVQPNADGSITLPASAAEIHGPTLVFETKYGNLGYWSTTEDHARWTLEVPRGGDWIVELDFACDDSAAGGLIRFSTGTRLLTARVPGTGTWDNYQTWRAGTIDLHRGKVQLTVTTPDKPGMALIDLRAIRLIPPE